MVCIVDYKNYTIDELGNVFSIRRNKYLKSTIDRNGYVKITLCEDYKQKIMSLHRLLAIHFIPNPLNKLCVNHKDGNKQNNSLDNLEWCTHSENIKHAYSNKLMIHSKGKNHHNAKPVFQYSKQGILIKKWDCVADVARTLDCNPDCINRACRGIRKTYKKTIWKYNKMKNNLNNIRGMN